MLNFNIDGIIIRADKENICVKDSYKINNKDLKEFAINLKVELASHGYHYSRSAYSWYKEILAHNILYRHGLFKSHTVDTDLSEKENKVLLFVYTIITLVFK